MLQRKPCLCGVLCVCVSMCVRGVSVMVSPRIITGPINLDNFLENDSIISFGLGRGSPLSITVSICQ